MRVFSSLFLQRGFSGKKLPVLLCDRFSMAQLPGPLPALPGGRVLTVRSGLFPAVSGGSSFRGTTSYMGMF